MMLTAKTQNVGDCYKYNVLFANTSNILLFLGRVQMWIIWKSRSPKLRGFFICMALDYFLESPKPSPAQEELVDTKSEQKNAEINSAQINPESTLPTIPHIPEETISADTPTPTPSELLPPPAEELPSEMEKPEIEKEESEPVITEAVPPTPSPVEVDLPTDVKIESASPVSVDSYVAEKEVVNSNLAYIPAPNYLDAGRGLVYNCTHKHWACVSAESYIQCDQNQKWSKQEKKNPECFIAEIYLNIQDCHKAQIIKVDTSADTGFCHL